MATGFDSASPHAMQQHPNIMIPAQQQPGAGGQSRRSLLIGALLEIGQRLLQVLMHSVRSGQELFSIAIGSYYTFHTVRGMLGIGGPPPPDVQQRLAAMSGVPGAAWGAEHIAGTVARSPPVTKPSGNRLGVVKQVLFFVAIAAAALAVENTVKGYFSGPRDEDEAEGVSDVDEGLDVATDAASAASPAGLVDSQVFSPVDTQPAHAALPTTSLFVAIHDFVAQGPEQLSFRQGDQFSIPEYRTQGWCLATRTAVGTGEASLAGLRGLVPGNYVQQMVRKRLL